MIGLLAGVALAASADSSCLAADPADLVVERKAIDLGAGEQLEAVSVSRRGDGTLGFEASRLVIYSAGCQVVFEQRFGDTTEAHFALTRLGGQPVLVLSAVAPGGSACVYQHLILAYGRGELPSILDDLVPLAPMDLGHSNMDRFYVGDLGRGRGAGLVLWEAIWDSEAHYVPHRYRVSTYRWCGGRFIGPVVWTTRRKYRPEPNLVAKHLGFAFRDATRPEQFTVTFDHGGC